MEILVKAVEYFNMSEKDIVMWLFIGGLLVCMFVSWAVEDARKWYKRNKRYHQINLEFLSKLLLAPVLSLVLIANGVKPEARKKRVARFIYS